MNSSRPKAILVLEDGLIFHGRAFGAIGKTFGEAVFTTGMSGYQETLTDPSYYRQVVISTAVQIGNTGWNDEDNESGQIWVAGYVVRDPSPRPSNWRAKRALEDELIAQNIVGICEVDTRALTRHIRELGSLRVGICSSDIDPEGLLSEVLAQPLMAGADLAKDVATNDVYIMEAWGKPKFRVAAVDLGIKSMTPNELAKRGVEVHIFPANASYQEIASIKPDGVFFSNGPGDPATAEGPMQLLKQVLADEVPYFGICFGNQIFGRALGFDTYKLKYGHRGINQPVMDRTTGKVEITAQNHGFAVKAPIDKVTETAYGNVEVSHISLNDSVVEGLQLTRNGKLAAFSVQYHPEAAAGPHDANYLFDRFIKMMADRKDA